MPAPRIDTGNILNKIKDLEGERAYWLEKLPRLRGTEKKLAQTTLTYLDQRLRWLRGRSEGTKPTRSQPYPERKRRDALNKARLAEVRS